MTIQTFAEQQRLKISRDECGDEIIQGRRGHLYFDNGILCLMVTDGKVAKRSKWQELGSVYLWLGEISQGLQDVSIKGIPLENAGLAIKMCGIKRRQIKSPAQEAVFARAREASKAHRYGGQRPLETVESSE